MNPFPTVQASGIKILDQDQDNLMYWLVIATVTPRDSLIDRANFDALIQEFDMIGEGFEIVETPLGQALLIPPDASGSLTAAEKMVPAMKAGHVLDIEVYTSLLHQVTEACWEQLGVVRRLDLCLAAGENVRFALSSRAPKPGSGTLRTLAENEAKDWVFT